MSHLSYLVTRNPYPKKRPTAGATGLLYVLVFEGKYRYCFLTIFVVCKRATTNMYLSNESSFRGCLRQNYKKIITNPLLFIFFFENT